MNTNELIEMINQRIDELIKQEHYNYRMRCYHRSRNEECQMRLFDNHYMQCLAKEIELRDLLEKIKEKG